MDIWYSKDERKIDKYKYLIMLDLKQDKLKNLSKEDRMVGKYMSEIEKLNEDPAFREYMTKEEDDEKIRNTELHNVKKEIARNLKKDGMPIDAIARNTGLSKEEIEKL